MWERFYLRGMRELKGFIRIVTCLATQNYYFPKICSQRCSAKEETTRRNDCSIQYKHF